MHIYFEAKTKWPPCCRRDFETHIFQENAIKRGTLSSQSCKRTVSQQNHKASSARIIDQSHKSQNAPVPYPTIHHSVQKMCTFLFWMVHCGYVNLVNCWYGWIDSERSVTKQRRICRCPALNVYIYIIYIYIRLVIMSEQHLYFVFSGNAVLTSDVTLPQS